MGKPQISHQVLIGQSKHYENGNLSILIFSTPPILWLKVVHIEIYISVSNID
jgi:hypothetical protein